MSLDSTEASPSSPSPRTSPPVPAHADGVELLGEMEGSGYREPPALVRRADGQVLQLTPLLYRVLESVDGIRDAPQIADRVRATEGRDIGAADVQTLIDRHLLPLGLLRLADGSQPAVKKSDPLLRMRFRIAVTDPAQTRRITRPFTVLFAPFIVIPMLLAFAAVCWWVLMVKGLASATHEAFDQPGLLLLVFVITLLSAGFHEFGHAAAATRAGAAPGAMGAGLYLVWPAFYTDVTDSYRLNKPGRLMTDVGGLYFNTMVAVGTVGIWWLTGFDALLLIVATQLVLMVRQLVPIVRFDGYHILADATGVPDLYRRIAPTLLALLPWRWNGPEARVLTPGARFVITVWVLVTVPLLLLMLATIVLAFPRLLGTAWRGLQEQAALVGSRFTDGDVVAAAGHGIGILAIAIPMAGLIYILVRLVRQLVRAAWVGNRDRPVRRTVAMLAILALFAAIGWAWWPRGENYRPIEAYEAGTLPGTVAHLVAPPSGLQEGRQGSTVAMLPAATKLPGPDEPALSVVLVPRDPEAPAWVFPFARPGAPEDGDTQALAVATEDGSVVYDVAFALVWAGGDTVDTTNEAYAFASCTGCTAVAVSFQVVLIAGQADVIVPQNLSAAVNYECVECVAHALASQLVITLEGPLSSEQRAELDRLWAEIAAYGESIRDRPLSEIADALARYKREIIDIVAATEPTPSPGAPSPTAEPSSAPTTSSAPTPDADPTRTPEPGDDQPRPTPTATPRSTPAPSPTPTPTAATRTSPAPTPTPSPSAG